MTSRLQTGTNGKENDLQFENYLAVLQEPMNHVCKAETATPTPELTPDVIANTPIMHKPYYQGERQLFGYDPLFQPSAVTFDRFNRPYIRTTETTRPVIQTLCKCGEWVESDFLKALPNAFEDAQLRTGSFFEERIVFDRDGDVYTLAHLNKPHYTFFLFHSSDHGESWKAHQIPFNSGTSSLTFEYTGMDGNYVGVPLIFARVNGGKAAVISFTKSSQGLSKPDVFYYSGEENDTYNVGLHSGPPNPGVRVGNKVHVVWASMIPAPAGGTPQYATTIDLETKEILPPVYLGSTSGDYNKPDVHNVPSIVYDGETLHVVLGSHHDQFQYLQSTGANTRTWTSPLKIGRPKPKIRYGSYTYVGMVVDKDKTLHLVSRFAGDGYVFELVYMRKRLGEDWSNHKVLVKPWKAFYGVWYHKVSLDRDGRLFVSYKYYGDQMTQDAVNVYHERWPESPRLVINSRRIDPIFSWKNIRPHDPVILISEDSGDTFHIATTPDFLKGFKRSPDIDGDGRVGLGDLSKLLVNWGDCDPECESDINSDGTVDTSDLSEILVNWGDIV